MKEGAINVNPSYIKALLRVAAKQDIRYYLNGVFVQTTVDGGKFYVATDGHRIGVFHEGWGSDKPRDLELIIPREVVDQLRFDKKITAAILQPYEGKMWTLDPRTEAGLNFTPIEGKYPEWRRVLPENISGEIGDYNLNYVADFCLLAQDAGISIHQVGVLLWQNGSSGALITARSEDFIGVLMPVRVDAEKRGGPPSPHWFKRKEDAAVPHE